MIGVRALLFASLLLMAGCGQRGDLYLPDKPATKVEPPAQPAQPKEEPKQKDD